ncbi:MAG: phosphatase PAP2 family protein [Tannerella sp.]|jgi:undecaprenyl-diphosphatase|nr:phosphatase PAP2 family protein [Tannerella sp.]
MEWLLEYEREWFLTVNGSHTNWQDHLMFMFVSIWVWLPLFLFPLYFIIRKRKEWLSVLLCTILTGATSVIVTEVFVKPLFKRYRPTRHPSFMNDITIVNDYIASGDYGFISGHSTNAFAFAVMSALIVKNKWYSAIIFIWAVIMVYSRVYLGVHFITDVVPGMVIGSFIGWFLYLLYRCMQYKKEGLKQKNRNDYDSF